MVQIFNHYVKLLVFIKILKKKMYTLHILISKLAFISFKKTAFLPVEELTTKGI